MKSLKYLPLLSLFLLLGCDDNSPSQNQAPQRAASVATGAASSAPTSIVHWPPASQGPVELSPNLLATVELLLLDNSGSMASTDHCTNGRTRFQVAQDALAEHVRSAPNDKIMALAVFLNGSAEIKVNFGIGETHKKGILEALYKLVPDQGTPLKASLKWSFDTITQQAQKQLGYGIYRIVVLTDGESRDGDPAGVARGIAHTSPVELHVVGFCLSERHDLNIPGITSYYAANNPETLRRGLAATQAETPYFDAAAFTAQ